MLSVEIDVKSMSVINESYPEKATSESNKNQARIREPKVILYISGLNK